MTVNYLDIIQLSRLYGAYPINEYLRYIAYILLKYGILTIYCFVLVYINCIVLLIGMVRDSIKYVRHDFPGIINVFPIRTKGCTVGNGKCEGAT